MLRKCKTSRARSRSRERVGGPRESYADRVVVPRRPLLLDKIVPVVPKMSGMNVDGSKYSAAARKAMAISAKIRAKYPYADYGRAFYKRGTPENIARFGPTFRGATPAQKSLRRSVGYVGRGGYWGRKFGGMLGMPNLGDKLGDFVGAGVRAVVPHGNMIMDAANSVGRAFAGQGAYVSNSLVKSGGTDPIPGFAVAPDGSSVIVTHKEYLRDIYGSSSAFSNIALQINPGQSSVFPWLSQIARNYDEYELKQCMFFYRSTTSDIGSSTNGQVGTVLMATQYNAENVPFSDKDTMLQYDGAMSAKTTEDLLHGVECDPSKLSGSRGRFVRPANPLSDEDLNTYDHAQFNLAVCNTPSGFNNLSLGELWISYTIVLRKPKQYSNLGLDIRADRFLQNGSALAPLYWGTSTSNPLLSGLQNSIGCTVDNTTSGVCKLTFPPSYAGYVEATFRVGFSTAATTAMSLLSLPTTGNITFVNDLYGTGDNGDVPGTNFALSTTNNFALVIRFRVKASTGGVANALSVNYSPAVGGVVANAAIEVTEFNPIFLNANSSRAVWLNPYTLTTTTF